MLPALGDGDRVLAVRTPPARIRRGAVVVGRAPAGVAPAGPVRLRDPVNGEVVELVADPDPVFVKRVAGVPGDRVRPRHAPVGPDGSTPTAEVEVPAGTFFVEGETTFSMDSCLWGPVPADHVLGVVVGASRRTARAPRTGVQVPR